MPLPEDYDLWCELNPCPECEGTGDIPDDGYGDRTCRHCDGSGIDPDSVWGEGGEADA